MARGERKKSPVIQKTAQSRNKENISVAANYRIVNCSLVDE
jgi:hypothetical protein